MPLAKWVALKMGSAKDLLFELMYFTIHGTFNVLEMG
jgi:hypothetical protein